MDSNAAYLLEAIIDESSDAIVVHALDGKIVGWNRGAQMIYGYGTDQAMELNIDQLLLPGFQSDYWHFVSNLLDHRASASLEMTGMTREGQSLEMWLTATPVGDSGGDIRHIALTGRDVTDRKRERIKLNNYLDSSPDAIIVVGIDGAVRRANLQVKAMFGYEQEELLGKHYEKLIPSRFREVHRHHQRHFFNSAKSREMGSGLELYARHKSGGDIPVQISLTPSTVADETSVLVRIRDITHEVEIKQALLRAKDEAERSDRAKTRFLAAASHDLRQPLHSINMYLSVLENQLHGDRQRQVINQCKMSLDSISQLLNSLLDISRLESGNVAPKIRNIPVNNVLERVYNNGAPAASGKSQKFSLIYSSQIVRCDENLLEQLLANVVGNAIRYSDKDSHIVMGCRRRGDRLEIQVLDNGIGISPDRIESIFDDYVQGGSPPGLSMVPGVGLGLGLAIVKRIAELLELQVSIESEPGRGTVFRVLAAAGKLEPTADAGNADGPAKSSDITGATVLLLEDDTAVLDSTQLFLESFGLRVLPALTLSRAHQLLDSDGQALDLVIADYSLGDEQNGLEAIKTIRAAVRRSIPAILITGHTSSQLTHEAKIANCEIARKPFDPGRLLDIIKQLLH